MTETAIPDWQLQAWMKHLKKRQTGLVKDLGWNKSRANLIFHGKQQYTRATVAEVSRWLEIEPYELLMLPSDALQLRQLREAAIAIASRQPT